MKTDADILAGELAQVIVERNRLREENQLLRMQLKHQKPTIMYPVEATVEDVS